MEDDGIHLPKVPPLGMGNGQRVPTIREIWTRMNDLHEAYLVRQQSVDTAIETLTESMKKVEIRMKTYEQSIEETKLTLKNNTEILKDIKSVSAFTRKAIKIGAWPAGIIAAGFISQFGVYLYHLWFH